MKIKLRNSQVLWPSRLEKSGATILVKTCHSVYQFVFKKQGIVVTGGKVGSGPAPAKIHGMKLLSAALWCDRIMNDSSLEFNGWRTSPIKSVTIQASKKTIANAVGRWPDEEGGPCETF